MLKAQGKAALAEGEALAAEGQHAEAIALFEAVPTYAPREYKMCQRAGLQAGQHTFIVLTRPTPVHSVMDDAASTGTLCGG